MLVVRYNFLQTVKFESVVLNLIEHPELTSKLILRAEILWDSAKEGATPGRVPTMPADGQASRQPNCFDPPQISGYRHRQTIVRKLCAKVPERDASITQQCFLYDGGSEGCVLVILKPNLDPGMKMPFYHPQVGGLAFRYLPSTNEDTEVEYQGTIHLDLLPLEYGTASAQLTERDIRTCTILLETIAKHGWGAHTGYKKRMHHDTVVARNPYQDLYQEMKAKYKHLTSVWAESTDPIKNVFEDIGIATFLILLWRDMYPPELSEPESSGHPPGGFVDIGCGAGLLVHILISEGFHGEGIDIRARKSWKQYPPETQSHLHVHGIDPTASSYPPSDIFPPGCFLIGNHADELSPWLPITAALSNGVSYLSIPCCSWALDQKFHRNDKSTFPPLQWPIHDEERRFEERLGDTKKSTYGAYLCWLMALSRECGFALESETLRIPSTRNWVIIGRAKPGNAIGKERAQEFHSQVVARGLFKTRQGANSHS